MFDQTNQNIVGEPTTAELPSAKTCKCFFAPQDYIKTASKLHEVYKIIQNPFLFMHKLISSSLNDLGENV